MLILNSESFFQELELASFRWLGKKRIQKRETPETDEKQIEKGNKKKISRSKIKNKIATIKNLISNSVRESEKGLKPHS